MGLAVLSWGVAARAEDASRPTPQQAETAVLITASTEVGWLRSVCPGFLENEARRWASASGTAHPPTLAATRCQRVLKDEQPEPSPPPG